MQKIAYVQILGSKMKKASWKKYGVITFGLLFAMLMLVYGFGSIHPLTESEFDIIYARRVKDIIEANHNPALSNQWRNELNSQGTWSDVDYTTGCPARRAAWPVQEHCNRIITMASVWSKERWDADLFNKISLALKFWFDNDYHSDDCINAGGRDKFTCPCGTPGFWNMNWYCQMILMPGLVGNVCLLLKGNLTPTQVGNCTVQMRRSYDRIDGSTNGRNMAAFTGANMLDISSIGFSLALLTEDFDLMEEALGRVYNESQFSFGSADGIKIDGSFMQHNSQLYTGNYGKVFMRNLIHIFIQTAQTSLAPPLSVQSAFLTLFSASEWFIYKKYDHNGTIFPKLMWQYSVIGRMVSYKYEDWNGIDLNLDEVLEATRTWTNHKKFQTILKRLRSTNNNVNPGFLVGTRYFYTSDYMVHRGDNYIVTLKMFSNRTTNFECHNKQNPYGLHLSDGNIYTYLSGNEYINVFGAWNWNLIPGTTVDYGAKSLSCSGRGYTSSESFVGGVTLGKAGIAVMNFTDPIDEAFHWCKTYFFFPGSYIVQFVGQAVSTNKSVPIVTTIDQRQLTGPVYTDGQIVNENLFRSKVQSIWHDKVGYQFLYPVDMTVDIKPRQSDWAGIGISVGNETQNIFAAYFHHSENETRDDTYTYIAHLDISQQEFLETVKDFEQMRNGIKILKIGPIGNGSENTAVARGATYGTVGSVGSRYVSLAFLTSGEYATGEEDIQNVSTDFPILLLFMRKTDGRGWQLAAADPSQTLQFVNLRVKVKSVLEIVQLHIELPDGPLAGSTALTEFTD